MHPDDPNFPEEIPPIPEPPSDGAAGGQDGDASPLEEPWLDGVIPDASVSDTPASEDAVADGSVTQDPMASPPAESLAASALPPDNDPAATVAVPPTPAEQSPEPESAATAQPVVSPVEEGSEDSALQDAALQDSGPQDSGPQAMDPAAETAEDLDTALDDGKATPAGDGEPPFDRGSAPSPAPESAALDEWDDIAPTLPDAVSPPWSRSAPPRPRGQRSRRGRLSTTVSAVLRQWHRLLQALRSRLPAPVRRLSDGVLTALVLGVLVLGLVLVNSGRSRPVPVVLSPAAPTTTETQAAEPEPASPPIAEIQAQLDGLSATYGSGLVQSVTVNLPRSQLTVNLDGAWYGLPSPQQDTLAQAILDQTRALDFNRLDLISPEGEALARNPVVGQTVVILRRRRPRLDLLPAA